MDLESCVPQHAAPYRLMVVEAETIARHGWRRWLEGAPSFTICAEAATAVEAEARWLDSDPEVAVIDPEIDGCGWHLLRELTHASKPVRCLVCLREGRAGSVVAALREGACAVALRTEPASALLEALILTTLGLRHLSPLAGRALGDRVARGATDWTAQKETLPARQDQLFRLLGQGFTPCEIAQKMGIACKTVQTHIFRLKTKLGLRTQAELCRRAILDSVEKV